jgi:hypothetical protein
MLYFALDYVGFDYFTLKVACLTVLRHERDFEFYLFVVYRNTFSLFYNFNFELSFRLSIKFPLLRNFFNDCWVYNNLELSSF